MRCGRVRRNLMAYHDGELGMADTKKVKEHLDGCMKCSGLLAALKKADHATGSAALNGPDATYWNTFTDRVMEKVEKETPDRKYKPWRVPYRSFPSPFRLAPALSVALVVVVAAGVLLKVREPAVRENVTLNQETSAVKKASPVQKGKHQVGGNADVSTSSGQARMLSEPSPAGQAEETGIKKEAPAPVPDSSSFEKKVPAGEAQRPGLTSDESGIGPAGKNDLLKNTPPSSTGIGPARSSMASPSGEGAVSYHALSEEEGSLPQGKAAKDGSWGQLAFARELEEEGNHVKSEEVLNDLLARSPSRPVKEQASILLVSVLASQNRLPEAKRLLDDVQRRYPDNTMIQNYRLGNGN
jgi:hypothetical protein